MCTILAQNNNQLENYFFRTIMKSTIIEVTYYVRGDGLFYAVLECRSCCEEPTLKIIPIVQETMDCLYTEYVSEYATSLCFTEWGCRREVQGFLKKVRKYLSTLQRKEICSETILL